MRNKISTKYQVPGTRTVIIAILGTLLFCTSCGSDPQGTPHPHGYFRIDLPEKKYTNYTGECPFSFDIPVYSEIGHDTNSFAEPCWINVEYRRFRATLHLSYKVVDPDKNGKRNTLRDYLEQSRQLAVQHQVKANAMKESPVMNDSAKVYGLIYEFGGNTASSLQFYVTDSTKNFMRGALYFFAKPNSDSVAPVYEFLKEDVFHMIETFRWNNEIKVPEKKRPNAEIHYKEK
jgi:gliding motility-associated lipoprotein GldD